MTAVRVVGAVLVREDGHVLAARRRRPLSLAGRWEFPGGKAEPDEGDVVALVRECREELGVAIDVGGEVGRVVGGGIELVLYAAALTKAAGSGWTVPVAGPDHDRLAWLAADALAAVPWLPLDAELLDAVRAGMMADDAGPVTRGL